MTTHNGACNHGLTSDCAACDYERSTAMANLRIDLGNARADWITRQQDRDAEIAKLRAENTSLAAGVCIVPGGLIGDEGGTPVCTMRAERDEVRALNSAMIATLPGTYYMDPPDGGSVMPEEQMRRMSQDAARYRWLRDGERTLREWDSIRDLWESTLDAAIDAALSKEGK